jgi:hypothetical protein
MSIIFGQKGFHAAATPQCQEAIHGTGNSFFMIDAMLPIQVQAEYQDRLTQVSSNHPVKTGQGRGEFVRGVRQPSRGVFFLARRALAALRRFAMRPRAYLIGRASNASGS